ncbi:MAG: 2,3-diphosphoglycerate-dependent phosphoglycerate mutase [bacterium]
MYKVVLLRHGESEWNRENLFTGWTDVDLDDYGREQAKKAGRLIKKAGIEVDLAFTSFLKRAIHTLWLSLDEMDLAWIPEYKSWRLNERHYGALQGLNKSDTAAEFGEEQVKLWRRCYDVEPPALTMEDHRDPSHDPRYEGIDPSVLPHTESLEDTIARVMPYWADQIVPQIKSGKVVFIVAHGNTLRALAKHLDGLTNEQVMELNIPIGEPLVYELDDELRPTNHYYLNSPEEIEKGIQFQIQMGKAPAQENPIG